MSYTCISNHNRFRFCMDSFVWVHCQLQIWHRIFPISLTWSLSVWAMCHYCSFFASYWFPCDLFQSIAFYQVLLSLIGVDYRRIP